MQLNLLPPSSFSVVPEVGRTEPRLWVRRLVIWQDANIIIRDIVLKPGLNIIWSPDPGTDQEGPIGHGAGKTMFCRLLRYCLGEDSIAPEGQRQRMLDKLPMGCVGAEVMLDGEMWVVTRALVHQRQDVVFKNGSLDQIVGNDVAATGISPLRDAIASAIIGEAAKLMPASIGASAAWQAALAWLTRDQECRFGHLLDWRDPQSDSHSPVRGRSKEDRLGLVRALVGALTLEEIESQKSEVSANVDTRKFETKLGHIDWQIDRTRTTLSTELDGGMESTEGGGLEVVHFRNVAAAKYAAALKLPATGISTNLDRARKERDEAVAEHQKCELALNSTSTLIAEKERTLPMVRAEQPAINSARATAKNPVCPICLVPIDTIKAAGCGISLEKCDLEALNARYDQAEQNIKNEVQSLNDLKSSIPAQQGALALSHQRKQQAEARLKALDDARDSQNRTIRAAQKLVDDVERYDTLLSERDTLSKQSAEIDIKLIAIKDALTAHRDKAKETLRNISERFGAVLKELVPGHIDGEAKLDGNGLTLKVDMGGDLSTAAIDSLKVVAFDIAAMVLSIEGKTHLPAFFVHDSPREADLGSSIYNRLFKLAKMLEEVSAAPLFQYIVTTTTEPPNEFQSLPWLRLELHGRPSADRLLKTDL